MPVGGEAKYIRPAFAEGGVPFGFVFRRRADGIFAADNGEQSAGSKSFGALPDALTPLLWV